MTDRLETTPPRHVACSRCGTEFSCTQSETCWCAGEDVRLPMPDGREDCLCRECLRKAAESSLPT